MSTQHERSLHLQVVSDMICPWCFNGKRSLDQALEVLAGHGVHVDVEWLPYQLNPGMPAEGMDRKEFRTLRFGWENALAMDARAVEAGQRTGAEFNYQLQSRTPNTVPAHALARLAYVEGGAALQGRVVEGLFAAYFTHGNDISDQAVLERIADEAGMESGAVNRSLPSHIEVRKLDAEIRSMGLSGVPSYLVNGKLLFSGSQDVEGYVKRLASAANGKVTGVLA
ncbi:DsbA family oxidoreductase [Rhodanobacter sp. MP7CTX1]|uniref:DsbA family oxidoreductase n=1 Tax=Rhodanobacter sp. MP7CTX1 TaxID=2723084 RepID=UPI0016216A48|nr:DsbA family oxidoreductase [Rhodanobacter sp. MP7CTX1]MBB6187100.1 putative DsbA family dithiol-disulfide isomerase [Rhodanobacter sp. MP7CTX1]